MRARSDGHIVISDDHDGAGAGHAHGPLGDLGQPLPGAGGGGPQCGGGGRHQEVHRECQQVEGGAADGGGESRPQGRGEHVQ